MQKQVFSSFGLKSRNGIVVTWLCYAELYTEQFNCFSKQLWSFSFFITNIKHIIFSTHSPTHNIHFYYCHLINMKWCLTVPLIFISLIMLSIVFLYILAICLPTFIIIIILNVVESKILACYETLSQCQHLGSWGRMLLSSWPGCATQTNSALNIKINRNHYSLLRRFNSA